MKPPFTLLQSITSRDTVQCVEHLLEQAKSGECIGVAYVAMYRRRKYAVHVCGETHRNPTWTRGAVTVLQDELGAAIREDAQ